MTHQILNQQQVAEHLGLSTNIVRGIMRSGRIKSERIGNARYVAVAELDRFIDSLTSGDGEGEVALTRAQRQAAEGVARQRADEQVSA